PFGGRGPGGAHKTNVMWVPTRQPCEAGVLLWSTRGAVQKRPAGTSIPVGCGATAIRGGSARNPLGEARLDLGGVVGEPPGGRQHRHLAVLRMGRHLLRDRRVDEFERLRIGGAI